MKQDIKEVTVSMELIQAIGNQLKTDHPVINLWDRLNAEVVPQLQPKQVEAPKEESKKKNKK